MNYCTQEDLEREISRVELAALTAESGGDPETEVVGQVLTAVAAEIEAYLSHRYVLPLPEVPQLLRGIAITLAVYRLYGRRGVVPEVWRQRQQEARQQLQALAAGALALVAANGEPIPGRATAVVDLTASRRIFSRTTLADY